MARYGMSGSKNECFDVIKVISPQVDIDEQQGENHQWENYGYTTCRTFMEMGKSESSNAKVNVNVNYECQPTKEKRLSKTAKPRKARVKLTPRMNIGAAVIFEEIMSLSTSSSSSTSNIAPSLLQLLAPS